jgi:hypothetical protein
MICENCKEEKKCKPYFLRGYNFLFCTKKCLVDYLKSHPGLELYGTEVLQFNTEM